MLPSTVEVRSNVLFQLFVWYIIHVVSSCTSGIACNSSARPLRRISACPMFVMSAPQPDRCSRCALPFNICVIGFHHILLTSCEQFFTPARKAYDRDPVADYTSIQITAHASHCYTRNQIAGRREHHPSLKQRVVSTVVVLVLLTYLQLQPFGASLHLRWNAVIAVAKNEISMLAELDKGTKRKDCAFSAYEVRATCTTSRRVRAHISVRFRRSLSILFYHFSLRNCHFL